VQPMKRFRGIVTELRKLVRYASSNYEIGRANPGTTLAFPIAWQYDNLEAITLGKESYIGPFSEIVVLAANRFTSVPGKLVIGDRAVVGAFCNLRAAGGSLVIGKHTMLAQGVSLIASGHSVRSGCIYRDEPWNEEKDGRLDWRQLLDWRWGQRPPWLLHW